MPFDLSFRDQRTRIVIPKGFQSDGPTIPAFARLFFNPGNSGYMKAAFIHDWMLEHRDEYGDKIFKPAQCAAAFRDALFAAEVTAWRVYVMWLAVLIWTSRKG